MGNGFEQIKHAEFDSAINLLLALTISEKVSIRLFSPT